MKMLLTPENSETYELGDIYTESFIEDKNSATSSELTFNLLVSGEAGSI